MNKKKKTPKIPQVLLFTDINIYPDDLASLAVLTWLHKNKLINLRGVITEMGDFITRRRRALYAKGALCAMDMPFIRVVPSGDYEPVDPAHNTYRQTPQTALFEHAGAAILRSGNLFIQEFFKSVKEKEIVVLLNAPFPDFAHYMRNIPDIVAKKVKKIVAFGSALPHNAGELYFPDTVGCFNFKQCPAAAETLFNCCQEKNIKLVLACKESVKEIAAETGFLDTVQTSKNPVMKELLYFRPQEKESMLYDMFSALAVSDKTFLQSGGVFEKESPESPVVFAKVQDKELLKEKFTEIFKNLFEVKKISLDQLKRPQTEAEDGALV